MKQQEKSRLGRLGDYRDGDAEELILETNVNGSDSNPKNVAG